VSRLSPYLHFGVLSARLMHTTLEAADCLALSKTLARRLLWRDLAYWQLHHWPRMPHAPIRSHYAAQPWAPGWESLLPAWQRGHTVRDLYSDAKAANRIPSAATTLRSRGRRGGRACCRCGSEGTRCVTCTAMQKLRIVSHPQPLRCAAVGAGVGEPAAGVAARAHGA
jgi:hypothetical protein